MQFLIDSLRIIFALLFVVVVGFLLEGQNFFVFKKKPGRNETWKATIKRRFITGIKSLKMLALPLPFTVACTYIWYYIFYLKDITLDPKLEAITTAGWIPLLSILYSLLVAMILNQLWGEYKAMRMAVKNYDLELFMNLQDEQLSPLVHTLMVVISLAVLFAFMVLQYTDVYSGAIFVSSVAYLFSLIFFVVIEIDDPSIGTWVIKSIPKEWLSIDSREWRKIRNDPAHKKFLESLSEKSEKILRIEAQEEKLVNELEHLLESDQQIIK